VLWENRGMGEGGKITDALRLSLAVLEVGLDACFSNFKKEVYKNNYCQSIEINREV
jgi:hypothetical protein